MITKAGAQWNRKKCRRRRKDREKMNNVPVFRNVQICSEMFNDVQAINLIDVRKMAIMQKCNYKLELENMFVSTLLF